MSCNPLNPQHPPGIRNMEGRRVSKTGRGPRVQHRPPICHNLPNTTAIFLRRPPQALEAGGLCSLCLRKAEGLVRGWHELQA